MANIVTNVFQIAGKNYAQYWSSIALLLLLLLILLLLLLLLLLLGSKIDFK